MSIPTVSSIPANTNFMQQNTHQALNQGMRDGAELGQRIGYIIFIAWAYHDFTELWNMRNESGLKEISEFSVVTIVKALVLPELSAIATSVIGGISMHNYHKIRNRIKWLRGN